MRFWKRYCVFGSPPTASNITETSARAEAPPICTASDSGKARGRAGMVVGILAQSGGFIMHVLPSYGARGGRRDGSMDRACWNRFGFTLSLGLALAVTPTTRHLQANETDTMPPCGPRCVLVEVTLAKAQPYAPKVLLTGSIEPRFSSNIAFRTNGKIEQRLVEIGDHIAADQVLARLDPQVQRANLDAAKAGLVSAQALLTQASVTFDRQSELLKSGPHDKPMTRPSNNSEPSRRQLNRLGPPPEPRKSNLATPS